MRIRTIKPEFWSHPVMTRQTDHAQLIAIGLLNYADDHGYFYADPKLVRSSLRPLDDDSSNVRRSLAQLAEFGYIEIREHPTHGQVGRVVSFSDHQRVDRPKDSIIKDLFNSTNVRRLIVEASSLEGKGREGNNTSAEVPSTGEQSEFIQTPKLERKRDELFDALASATGSDPKQMTPTAARACGVALAEIKKATPTVTVEEVRARVAAYKKIYRDAACTPSAMKSHWAECSSRNNSQQIRIAV